jgi:type IV pilus assembly protein PilP
VKILSGDGQEDNLVKMIRTTIFLMALAGLIACGETPPAPAPQIVKQKISADSAASSAAAETKTPAAAMAVTNTPAAAVEVTDNQTAMAAVTNTPATAAAVSEPGEAETKDTPARQTEEKSPADIKEKTAAVTEEKTPAERKEKTASDLVQESLQIASSYNPEGRFDPFEPLFKEEPQIPQVVDQKGQRQKRVPQTPLERISLSQLKISAIIRAASGNRGLVEDATGKGYVVEKGTYIGLNSGKVTRIEPDRIVIEEEIENILGELVIQSTELKLQKPAGEL